MRSKPRGGTLCTWRSASRISPRRRRGARPAGARPWAPPRGYAGAGRCGRAVEAAARGLPVPAAAGSQPTLDMVRAAWGPRTKGLLLGSPSNPTGTVIAPGELRRIAGFIADRGGVLLADEIYQGLVYGVQPSSALGLPGAVVALNSFSKYFCMTGWRLGWIVLPEQAVRGLEKLAQHLFICAPTAAQHAAVAAFLPGTLPVLEGRGREVGRRRGFLVPALEEAAQRLARFCPARR